MKFKLKINIIESLLSDYESQVAQINTNPPNLKIELFENEILSILYPYFFQSFKKDLARSVSDYFMEDIDPVKKMIQEENTFLLELHEPWENCFEIVTRRYQYSIKNFIETLKMQKLPIIEGNLIEDRIVSEAVAIPLSWLEPTEEENIEIRIISSSNWRDISRKNPQLNSENIPYYQHPSGWHDNTLEKYLITLLKNDLVIGISECVVNPNEKILSSAYTSVIKNEQGKGYSELLIEARTKFAASQGLSLRLSNYTHQGFFRLRPKILSLSKEYSVPLIEQRLHLTPLTIAEAIFSTQQEIKEKLDFAKQFKHESIYINSQQMNLIEKKPIIERFLDLDPYEYQKEDIVKFNWSFLLIFIPENLLQRISNTPA